MAAHRPLYPENANGLEVAVANGLEVVAHSNLEVDKRYHQHSLADGETAKSEVISPEKNRILGVRRRNFWIIVIIIVIVIAAAIGGGIGGALSSKRKSDSSESDSPPSNPSSSSSSDAPLDESTSIFSQSKTPDPTSSNSITATTSTTTTAASTMPSTGLLALDCPAIDEEIYTRTISGRTSSFQYNCQYDNNVEGGASERLRSPSVDTCIDLCIEWNQDKDEQECNGVTWNGNLTSSIAGQAGNCFLILESRRSINLQYCGDKCPLAVTAIKTN